MERVCRFWISLKSTVCVVCGNNQATTRPFKRPPKSDNTEIQVNLLSSLNTLQQGSLYNQPKHCTMRGISLKITIDFRFHNPFSKSSLFFPCQVMVSGPHLWAKFSSSRISVGGWKVTRIFLNQLGTDLSTGSLQRYQPGGRAFLLHLSHGHQQKPV